MTLALARRPWRFQLGRLVATPNALRELAARDLDPVAYINRHVRGEWGPISEDDAEENESSLFLEHLPATEATTAFRGRILSRYDLGQDVRVLVITEADRSSTCILLPEDY